MSVWFGCGLNAIWKRRGVIGKKSQGVVLVGNWISYYHNSYWQEKQRSTDWYWDWQYRLAARECLYLGDYGIHTEHLNIKWNIPSNSPAIISMHSSHEVVNPYSLGGSVESDIISIASIHTMWYQSYTCGWYIDSVWMYRKLLQIVENKFACFHPHCLNTVLSK